MKRVIAIQVNGVDMLSHWSEPNCVFWRLYRVHKADDQYDSGDPFYGTAVEASVYGRHSVGTRVVDNMRGGSEFVTQRNEQGEWSRTDYRQS